MPDPIYVKAAADRHVSLADTATLIRRSLTANFPGVRFYVRSSRYSGGSSIDVGYDGISGYAPLRACYCPNPTTRPDDPARCAVCGYVGRLDAIYVPGAPTIDAVNAVLAPYHGRDFDGMIDGSNPVYAWLNPDGSATLGRSPGSGASLPAYAFPRPLPGAVLVHFGASFVFAEAHLPYNVKRKAAAA